MLAAEVRTLNLDDLRVADYPETGVYLPQSLCGGGFSGSGCADQKHMICLIRHWKTVLHSQCPNLDLILEFGDRLFHIGEADLVGQQLAAFGEQLRAPFAVLALRCDVPLVGTAVDRSLGGGEKAHSGIGERAAGGRDQHAADGGLRQPDCGIGLVVQLAETHPADIRQVRRDQGEFIGIDRLGPTGPVQCDAGLPEMCGRMGRERVDRRGERRQDNRLGRQDPGGLGDHVGPPLRGEHQVGADVLAPVVVLAGVEQFGIVQQGGCPLELAIVDQRTRQGQSGM